MDVEHIRGVNSLNGLDLPDIKKIILGIVRDADNALTREVITRRSGLPDSQTDHLISILVDEENLTYFPGDKSNSGNKHRYVTVPGKKEAIERAVADHLWELSAAGKLYFAYGSDLNPEEMYKIRCPGSHFLCKGSIKGFELSFNLYLEEWEGTVPSIRYSGDSGQVWGALYCIGAEDWNNLDGYEDVPRLNRRVKVPVCTTYGVFCADCYQSLPGDKNLPSGKYLEKMLTGSEFFGLPQKHSRYIKSLPVKRRMEKG